MRLYDIDEAIASLIDEETGEIVDFEAFENLNIERERKIEFLCKSIKEAPVLADALQSEIKRLQDKKASIVSKAERYKAYLQGYLGGEKYKSPLFTCYYGSTKEVTGDEAEFKEWALNNDHDEFLKFKEPELDKASIKKAIANGEKIPFLTVQDKQYLCIK
jgi:hypothetical protein